MAPEQMPDRAARRAWAKIQVIVGEGAEEEPAGFRAGLRVRLDAV